MNIQYNIPLAKHTYFKLGGVADQFVEVVTREELIEAVRYAITAKLPYLVLGGGSNVLISDHGFRGLVIKNKTGGIKLKGFSGKAGRGRVDLKDVIVEAESGVPANKLIRYTLDEGLSGLEDFLGLPGTVGGAIYNNSHHLGKLIGDLVTDVEVIDQTGSLKRYEGNELKFGYDSSIFHETHETIVSASFRLGKGNKIELWARGEAAVRRRAQTQPLGVPSSGCMFKNISQADAMRLGTPNHTLSAGYLIDKAGLKGLKVGGASVSSKHANFIIQDGTATSQDVLDLVAEIKKRIKAHYGVDLEEEVIVLQ